MVNELIIDIIGWAGAGCLLFAYWLVSTGRVVGRSWSYQAFNITGAVLLSVNSGYHGAFPSVGLNVFWISIGLMTVYSLGRSRRDDGPTAN